MVVFHEEERVNVENEGKGEIKVDTHTYTGNGTLQMVVVNVDNLLRILRAVTGQGIDEWALKRDIP